MRPTWASAEHFLRAVRTAARRPFESLPTRIIVSVFATALVTSAVVTGISTHSTESFLRSKMNERFPAVLKAASQRLDLWYGQRRLDIDTFARSDFVAGSLQPDASPLAVEEARKYLAYVREGFPQYRTLFALDVHGREHVRVGDELSLPRAVRADLARVAEPRIGPVIYGPGGAHQIVSAPVTFQGAVLGTLHAAIAVSSVGAILGSEELEPTTRLYAVGPKGRILARAGIPPGGETYDRSVPAAGAPARVEDYVDASGVHVVGSAVAFPTLDWTLVVEQSYDVAFAPVVSVIRNITAINFGIVLGFGLVALLIARSIVRPIQSLSDVARRIAQGETDVVIPASRAQDEIGVLSRALHEMVSRLQRNQVELERRQQQIEHANLELRDANEELRRGNEVLEQLSFTDGLTRLHNHRYFQDRLRIEARRCDRTGDSLALLLLDIDDFKSLNDRYGHAVGDEVLRRVAHIVNNTVRETDLPARYGGEEFAVLAPRTQRKGALALGEKLRLAVANARFRAEAVEGQPVEASVTVSVGVAMYAGDVKRFFNEADRGLYRAKAAGKDCTVCADADDA